MRALALWVGLVCGAAGCGVPHSEHDALRAAYDELQASCAAEALERETLRASVNRLEAEVAVHLARIAELEKKRSTLKGDKNKLEKQRATLVKERAQLLDSLRELQHVLDELARSKELAESRASEYRRTIKRFERMLGAMD